MTMAFRGLISCTILILVLLCVIPMVCAQEAIPIGKWRTHVSFNSVTAITESDSKIYAAAANGLMVLDRQTLELSAFTSLNGLAGRVIHSINFDRISSQLFIGYDDGSLDVVWGTGVINLDWLRDIPLSGPRAVNHITFSGGLAYLSTGYGIVVIDISRHEVKETWRDLGANGTSLSVYQSAIHGDSIFLATAKGVLSGKLDDNLLDFSKWNRYDAGAFNSPVKAVCSFKDQVYAAIDNAGLFHLDNGVWTKEDFLQNAVVQSLNSSDAHMVICETNGVWLLSEDKVLENVISPFMTSSQFAWEDNQGRVWIGDSENGLLSAGDSFVANGPAFNEPFRLNFLDGKIIAIGGGYAADFQPLGKPGRISFFADGMWRTEDSPLKDITDIQAVGGVVFASSYGFGIQSGPIASPDAIYNETNSSLINTDPPGDHVNITALATDGKGLWAANYGAASPLHWFEGGTWHPYSFPVTAARFPTSLAVDYAGSIWAVLNPSSGGGILVFNREDNNTTYLTDVAGGGGLPNRNVRCLSADRDGSMWVGTDNGVAYFVNPAAVFGTDVNAVRPIFENRFLLNGEKVTSIAVDGGDRKWVGTGRGVWLFGPNGDEMIYNFTSANSPLPSDNIRSIAVNGQSGEVFLATDRGMVSFRSDATVSDGNFSSVKIFPNPVTSEFSGLVGISGLAQDAVVKITDISGKLIWQTYAAGGTASWNVRHYNGQRATTGIYLVFSASGDGSQEYVGKIAVVE